MPEVRQKAIIAALVSIALVVVLLAMPTTRPLFHALYPDVRQPLYARASFIELTLAHLTLVAGATGLAALGAVTLGIAVTREAGRPFQPLVRTLATIGQTFPPVAVLALSVPLLGYGAAPTLAALILYAALPILEATLAGLGTVPDDVRDAASGLGFSKARAFWTVDVPLALPILVAGLRNATIINVGTAAIGSSVGALSLGSPILEGLSASNPAYVVEGALIVALLAIVVDRWFDVLDAYSSLAELREPTGSARPPSTLSA